MGEKKVLLLIRDGEILIVEGRVFAIEGGIIKRVPKSYDLNQLK